jgi:hypothetical protein
MKPFIGAALLLCACFPLTAGEAEEKGRVKKAAQQMADAYREGDFEKFADATYPGLVKRLGGRKKMVAKLKEMAAEMKSKQINLKSYKVNDPIQLAGTGDSRFAIVPYTMVMTSPMAKYTLKGFLVGASRDGGKSWTFIEGKDTTAEGVRKTIPDFPDSLKLPMREPLGIDKTK